MTFVIEGLNLFKSSETAPSAGLGCGQKSETFVAELFPAFQFHADCELCWDNRFEGKGIIFNSSVDLIKFDHEVNGKKIIAGLYVQGMRGRV